MSTRFIVSAVVGVAVGYFAGPQAGLQAFSLTYGVTGSLDPNKKVQGPRLDDLKMASAAYGAPIAYVEGHPRLAGNIVWSTDKREVAHESTQDGKGGPGVDTTLYTYECDLIVMIAENPGKVARRIWSNGALIWTAGDDATDTSIDASSVGNSWREIRFYPGGSTQMPDPTYEAAVGVGNAPAYRDRSTIVIVGLNLGQNGQFPVLTFELADSANGTAHRTDSQLYEESGAVAGVTAHQAYVGPLHSLYIPDFDGSFLTRDFTQINWDEDAVPQISISSGSLPDCGFPTNFVIGSSDEPYWIANGSTVYLSDSLGVSTTNVNFSTVNHYARYQSETLIMLSGNLPTLPRGLALIDGTVTATSYTPYSAAKSGSIWYVMPSAVDGTIRTYTIVGSVPVAGGTIVDPRPTGGSGGMLLADTVTGTLYLMYAGDVYEWSGSAWSTYLTGLPSYLRQASSTVPADVTISNGDLYAVSSPSTNVYRVWRARISNVYPATDASLDEVVQRQWQRAGLSLSYLDVTDLAGLNVRAMAISQVTAPRQVIETLASAYVFECVESGAIVRMKLRGGAPVLTIPYDDLGGTEGDPVEAFPRTRGNELELPAQVSVKFANVDDDYQDGNESSTRLATGSSIVSTIEVPLGLTPTEAKRLAEISVTDAMASLIRFGPVGLTRKYAAIEPTDVLLITGKTGSTYRIRVLKRTDSGGLANIEGVLDDATAINSSAVTSGGYNNTTIVRAKSPTDLELMDIPILRDGDNDPGFYAAAKPTTTDPWSGYSLLESDDDTTYLKIYESTVEAVIGTCSSTLATFTGGNTVDSVNTVSVDVGAGTLSSTTLDVLTNGTTNAALVGSEIIQFSTATLIGAGQYTLSGLLRGRRGTEWALNGHVADERFVLLTSATLRRVTDQLSDINVSRYWKGVTFGASIAHTASQVFSDTGIGLKPFAPVDFMVTRDATTSDITIAWHRRSRLSSRFLAEGVNPPLGEASEAYAVEIWNSTYTTLKRTISTSSATASYSAADQTTDFGSPQSTIYARVYQISSSVGRGYSLQAAA